MACHSISREKAVCTVVSLFTALLREVTALEIMAFVWPKQYMVESQVDKRFSELDVSTCYLKPVNHLSDSPSYMPT